MESTNPLNHGHSVTWANDLMHTGLGTDATSLDLFLDPFTLPTVPLLDWTLPEIGDEPLVQTFFEGPKKCNCCVNWVEKPPKEIPIDSQEKYQKAAIRVYKCKDHHVHDANGPKPTVVGGLTTSTMITSIEIQSPIIRREISPILAQGGRDTLETETIKIQSPFMELYFAHNKINDILKNQADGTKEQEHMRVMVDVMDEIFSDMIPEVSSLHKEKKITQKFLWTLFPKGITVYSRSGGEIDRLFEVVSVQPNFIECRFVDSDGKRFGWRKKVFNFTYKFLTGIEKISSLDVYPVGFHEDKGLEKTLARRGLRVLEYQDVVHCQYRDDDFSNGTPPRIVVDNLGYCQHLRHLAMELDLKPLWAEGEEKHSYNEDESEEEEEDEANDSVTPGKTSASRPSTEERAAINARIQQNPHWLRLMSPFLGGFSFTDGVWASFNVDNLEPISWNSGAIDRLVFPDEQKDLLLSFVINYNRSISHSDDLIKGKGQGLVVLLSGPPGTGKTLTVEAVAEKGKRPLYRPPIHSSASLGRILSEASTLATEYGAILLLDEADVFLRTRSPSQSDERNEMVAEMLRALEYHVGIIFLTTNLLEDIDHAFLSRIHMHLKYPDLSTSSRLTIWKDLLSQKRDLLQTQNTKESTGGREVSNGIPAHVEISMEDLSELARWQLNGREIKNILKVGRLWCQFNKYPLSRSRLETVITVCGPAARKAVTLGDTEAPSRKRARVEE